MYHSTVLYVHVVADGDAVDVAAQHCAIPDGAVVAHRHIANYGCGLGNEYMDRLGDFYKEVCRNGVYITEMLPGEAPSRFTFPERNRLISGMSEAVLVTYAGEKSGSLITAATAKKQKRRVYAMSERLFSSDGCKKLISEGAYIFNNAGDIAYPLREEFGRSFNEMYCNRPVEADNITRESYILPKEEKNQEEPPVITDNAVKNTAPRKAAPAPAEEKTVKEVPDFVSEDAKKIYTVLLEGRTDVNSLVDITGLPVRAVLTAVAELEIFGLIRNLPGAVVEAI